MTDNKKTPRTCCELHNMVDTGKFVAFLDELSSLFQSGSRTAMDKAKALGVVPSEAVAILEAGMKSVPDSRAEAVTICGLILTIRALEKEIADLKAAKPAPAPAPAPAGRESVHRPAPKRRPLKR